MKELIPINENNGKQAVSARALYEYLEAKERFSAWTKRMFKYGFIENVDYVGCREFNTLANQELEDYALTLDCAKEISMLQRSEKGKEARKYFIECEKRLKEAAKPLTPAEMFLHNAQIMVDHEHRITEVEQDVLLLKAQATTRPSYFTIAGYATLRKMKVSLSIAAKFGRKASDICRTKGYPIDKCNDPRFGEVNIYPEDVLFSVFDSPIN